MDKDTVHKVSPIWFILDVTGSVQRRKIFPSLTWLNLIGQQASHYVALLKRSQISRQTLLYHISYDPQIPDYKNPTTSFHHLTLNPSPKPITFRHVPKSEYKVLSFYFHCFNFSQNPNYYWLSLKPT